MLKVFGRSGSSSLAGAR